jgi:ArsR family transcriptional regulator, arsenate/arsenite/antimonite-responsive transcriptional repressor
MNRKLAAQCLSELGNLTRLDIYRLLVRGGLDGMKISDIQTRLGVPASTLAFHLGGLVGVALVSQERVGREVICRAKHRQLTAVMEFLREECCKGFDDEPVALRRAS